MGLVSTAFPPEALQKLRHGTLGICHTRYSTTGVSELQNCQPFVVDTMHGKVAVAHNGELVNAHALRKKVSCVSVTGCLSEGLAVYRPAFKNRADVLVRARNTHRIYKAGCVFGLWAVTVAFKCAVQVMRHGVGLSTSSDSELIIQLLALTPPMEELDAPDWVARSAMSLDAPKML